jgi:hypothetical protein
MGFESLLDEGWQLWPLSATLLCYVNPDSSKVQEDFQLLRSAQF